MKRQRRTREEWRKILVAWKRSGLTGSEFSASQDLTPCTLYRWSRKLGFGKKAKQTDGLPRVQVPSSKTSEHANGDIRIVPVPAHLISSEEGASASRKSSRLVLSIAGRFRIAVPDDFSPSALGKLVRTLEALR